MHSIFKEIPDRILENSLGALRHANTQAVFFDPGNEHWGNTSVLSAATAGELLIKAIIANQHPLLIFKDIFNIDDNASAEMPLDRMIDRSKTHDFQNLPSVLWAVCNERIPDKESFDRVRRVRNAIQHLFHPDGLNNYGAAARDISLNFIYKNIDPLLNMHFGLYAIEYHEDHHLGYDYVVSSVVQRQLKFSVPQDFSLSEIDLSEITAKADQDYKNWLAEELSRIGRSDLLKP